MLFKFFIVDVNLGVSEWLVKYVLLFFIDMVLMVMVNLLVCEGLVVVFVGMFVFDVFDVVVLLVLLEFLLLVDLFDEVIISLFILVCLVLLIISCVNGVCRWMLFVFSWFDVWLNLMLFIFKDCYCSRGELVLFSIFKLLMFMLVLMFSELILFLLVVLLNVVLNLMFRLNSFCLRVIFVWGEMYCWNWFSISCLIVVLFCIVCFVIIMLLLLFSVFLDVLLNVCGLVEICKLVV